MEGDEWEYEYSETETQVVHEAAQNFLVEIANIPLQDFYVTLDLTSRITPQQTKKGYVRLEHDIFADDDEADKDKDDDEQQASQQEATPDLVEENGTPHKEPTPEPEEQDRIQIVGLHDDNPIVSYQGQIYSCHWASTIGTDLFFARALPAEDREARIAEPMRKLNGCFELIGASSARLVARQAKLRPKTSQEKVQQPQPGPSHSFAPIQNPESMEVVKFPVPEHASRAQKRQANFLEKLSAVKARLGEKDKVKPTAYTSRGTNLRPGEDDGTQGQRTFVTSPSPERAGNYTFITEDGSDPPSPRSSRSPRQSPKRQSSKKKTESPNKRARRAGGRRGSTARRRAGRAQPNDSPLRNELSGEAGPSTESATPATWDELNQMDIT